MLARPVASSGPLWGQVFSWEHRVKKGRHRRFEEARALKRAPEDNTEPCPECGADPEDDHAAWCLANEDALDEKYGENPSN